jgi:hypothetical protein
MVRRALLLAAIVPSPAFSAETAEVLEWSAGRVFDSSVSRGVQLALESGAIELEEGELIEDDGPAAGFSYKPNEETLKAGTWIRKDLLIPDPGARAATLLVGSSDPLRAWINGQPARIGAGHAAGKYWTGYPFDSAVLQPGLNRIVLEGPGKIWIARDDEFASGCRTRTRHPNRSAKSTDGGRTWVDDRLGSDGTVDGEYYVRVYLNRYRSGGELILPVVDVGNLGGKPWGAPLREIGPVRIGVHADMDASGRILLRVRSGATPDPRGQSWSAWKELDAGGTHESPAGRYIQVAIALSTADVLKSPRLRGVRMEVAPAKHPDWTRDLKPVDIRNDVVVRTSIPFEYEPFSHPRLKTLRANHGLDEVVKDAKGEFDLIVRLARWTSGQWERSHLSEGYPPWDALAILAPHPDGTPVGGFCLQYNLVFLQACESFGLVGRVVSIGQGPSGGPIPGSGHEVVEIWSNEHRKWVYMDADAGWYAVEPDNEIPLSLHELRDRQLRALRGERYRDIRVVEIARTGRAWRGLKDWPPFLELRLVPRSNFLDAAAPLPLNQGMRGWSWTGHHVWADSRAPVSQLYGNRVHRLGNYQWTVNTVHIHLEPEAAAGEFRVHMETETPGFETFLADIDGAGKQPVTSGFLWKLREGRNRLEVWSRNSTGREGPSSAVVLER